MALLLLCYLALFHLGAHYAAELRHLPATEMLPRIAKIALGELSEELTAATIIVASLTLTIALSSIFADYCISQVKALRGRYREVLIATLAADYATSMLEFERIVHYSDLLLAYLYPPLILLTGANLALALRDRRASRRPAS
jgi:branched-subunit amino acid permease